MNNVKTRSFRLMLYPDDNSHMKSFKKIQRDPDFKKWFVGIWHTSGKKHTHILLHFENPRSWYQVLKDLDISERWCRPIGYKPSKKNDNEWIRCPKQDNWEKACFYLPHWSDLEKEQYNLSALWGSESVVEDAKKCCLRLAAQNVSQADCLLAVRSWVCSKFGTYITPMMFVGWITGTQYMKVANSVWVREMIQSHNLTVAQNAARMDDFDLQVALAAREEAKRQEERKVLLSLSAEEFDDFLTLSE